MNTPAKDTERTFSSGGFNSHFILILCTLLYMLNYMDRQVLSAVQEVMKTDLRLSDSQVGFIQTLFLMSIALFSLPVSFLADRWSRRKSLGIMATIWSVFTYCTGLGRSFLGILLPRTFVGVGEAGFGAVGTAMVTAAYPERLRSRVLGVFNLSIPLGCAIGVVAGGYISVHYGGWRTPFYVFAAPGLLLGLAALFIKDYKTAVEVDESGNRKKFMKSALQLFRIPSLRWLYIGYGMMQVMVFSFLVWGPTFYMRAHNVREDRAGIIVGIIGLMAIVGAILGGVLADLWQKKNRRARMLLPAIVIALSAVFLAIAYLLEFRGIGYAAGILYGILAVMSVPALGAVTQDVVTPGMKSSAWGMAVLTQYLLGGGWGPVIVGMLSDHLGGGVYGLKIALIIASCGGLLAGLCYWIGSRHYPEDMDRVCCETLEME
ncbi:MAG: MFS transporter [Spirochaetes bacterium]|nr:MFS transporter [Spirochaetota bacterium]